MPDEPAEAKQPLNAVIRRKASRAQWACGLCFGLLFLMGLSGIASITLLYDSPLYRTGVRGFEATVMNAVVSMKGVIGLIHGWGGYVGILLAGWAGLEVFSFGRRLKRTENPGWRRTGSILSALGLFGAAMLITSLLLLIPSGVAAQGFLSHDTGSIDAPAPVGLTRPSSSQFSDGSSRMVEWHTRELNYLMAFGAIILAYAAARIRRVSLEAKAEMHEEAEPAKP